MNQLKIADHKNTIMQFAKPQTKYTKSGRVNIAYQVIGSGPIDIVYIPGWISNIDLMWENPELSHFLLELTKIARVILFDKRGTGLSDRFMELSTLEDRMDDIRAVMDAAGSEQAALFGHSEGGSVSALFAATYPERTLALITFGVFAKRRFSVDYPWAPTDKQRQEVYDMIEQNWGSGEMDLVSLAPSKADDAVFMDWLSRYFRSGASPSAALVLTKMNTKVDIIDILNTIEVPSLFMCRTHDIDVKVEESKFMAEQIKGAKMVEFSGHDHLFWVGNTKEVLYEIFDFLDPQHLDTSLSASEQEDSIFNKRKSIPVTQFSSVLSVEIIDFHALQQLDHFSFDIIKQLVIQYRGQLIRKTKNGFTASFEGPSKAVHCALELRSMILNLGDYIIKCALHAGEIKIAQAGNVNGSAIHIANKLLQTTSHNEVLITRTIKNLISGAGLDVQFKQSAKLNITSQPFKVYKVEDVYNREVDQPQVTAAQESTKNHSFLENILQSIERHLSDEYYSIDQLCKELGLSQRQLQRKLKSTSNKTPNQMVRSVRLHRAKEFLLTDKKNISEAAFKTGFSSPSYFSKCFRKEFGMAPSNLMMSSV